MFVLLFVWSIVGAQELHVQGSAGPNPQFSVAYLYPTSGGGSVQAGVAYRAPTVQVFARFTEHVSASTIGNVTLEGAAHATFAGNYHGTVGVRGTIGPVAARFSVRLYNAPLGTFDAHEQLFSTRPASAGWGVFASATYRHNNIVFVVEPTIDFAGGTTYTSVTSDVRWLRAIGRHELRFRTELHFQPTLSGNVGATMVLQRGRKPAWEMGGFVSFNEHGVAPGVHALYHDTFPGFTLKLRTALTPFSNSQPFFALEATLSAPLETGTLVWDAALAAGSEVLGVTELRLVLPLP